jgi:preprotein translocase subunit SecE
MIATESEMRKVNWPSRRELVGSTWIVICGTLLMALVLLAIDVGFVSFFQWIGVLEHGAASF